MKKHVKSLLQQAVWLKWIPNALTLGNSLCGFAAILYTLQVYEKMMYRDGDAGIKYIFAVSALMIIGAMFFDAFDGFAARLLNAASLHGIQMDSLADMVTFGVAPATLVAVMAHSLNALQPKQFVFVWCLSAVYLGCAALRLAKYNVHAMLEKKSSDKFSGLPTPGAAAAICSLIFLFAMEHSNTRPMLRLISFLPYYAAALGVLMVSTIPYQHFGKWLFSVPRNKNRLFILVVIIAVFVLESFLTREPPVWTAAILINGYIIWAPTAFVAAALGFLKKTEEAEI